MVRVAGVLIVAAILLSPTARAETLVINANASDPAPRAAIGQVVDRFRKEFPDLSVEVNYYDHESYKIAIRNWLTSAPPDVIMWFAGNRMRQFSGPGLLADVSDIWTPERKSEFSSSAIDLVTHEGKQYGVPYSTYNWGLYYRTDLLSDVGLRSIVTWSDLLAACDRLKTRGITPIVIGTKNHWPAAAWFDYLDLRINGFDFHMQLMSGTVPYSDPRVLAVFGKWRELIDKRCFLENHVGLTWQEAQTHLYSGKGAMILSGNFIVPNFPEEVVDRLRLVPFPEVAAGVPRAEDAPANSMHIPARARNISGGKRFLSFMMRADVQELYNSQMKVLPMNLKSGVRPDRFLAAGGEIVSKAEGLAQFFDRDTSEELAAIAMRGFQEFMVAPDRLDRIVADIERARLRIYGKH